jgi:hypothetical protein
MNSENFRFKVKNQFVDYLSSIDTEHKHTQALLTLKNTTAPLFFFHFNTHFKPVFLQDKKAFIDGLTKQYGISNLTDKQRDKLIQYCDIIIQV